MRMFINRVHTENQFKACKNNTPFVEKISQISHTPLLDHLFDIHPISNRNHPISNRYPITADTRPQLICRIQTPPEVHQHLEWDRLVPFPSLWADIGQLIKNIKIGVLLQSLLLLKQLTRHLMHLDTSIMDGLPSEPIQISSQ